MQIEITSANNTLAGIRDAINASTNNPGVRATIVTGTDGAHLILSATRTGADYAMHVDAVAAGSPLEALEFGAGTTNSLTEATPAADATAKIDGFLVTSASNSIEGAIEGVTVDLLQAEPGTIVNLEVAYDTDSAKEAMTKFVDAYNAVVAVISDLTAYNADTGSAGALLGDAATRGIKNALREALGLAVGGSTDPFRTLAEIGVTTGSDGKLSLDSTKFSNAVKTDFDAVGRVLADADDWRSRAPAIHRRGLPGQRRPHRRARDHSQGAPERHQRPSRGSRCAHGASPHSLPEAVQRAGPADESAHPDEHLPHPAAGQPLTPTATQDSP